MHDICNPPFGHFGEQAINQWFISQLKDLACSVNSAQPNLSVFQQRPELAQDLEQFEGNAQAIRLVHSLLNLNLTYSQAAGILKYTRPGILPKRDIPKEKNYLMKKVGFYYSETDYIEALRSSLAIAPGCRHPVSYIMEAADDISYCLADIEDAVEKGLITTQQLSALLVDTFRDVLVDKFKRADDDAIAEMSAIVRKATQSQNYFISLRVSLSHPLVRHARDQFIQNIEQVFHGTYNQALLEDNSRYHAITETLKKIAIRHVFCHREVERLELQGFRIITGLLDCYKPLLCLDSTMFEKVLSNTKKAPLIEKHLAKKLPAKHIATYKKAILELNSCSADYLSLEFYHRCRLIQDYISGMTDQFAYDEYRMLMVID
jgi:dGTPase